MLYEKCKKLQVPSSAGNGLLYENFSTIKVLKTSLFIPIRKESKCQKWLQKEKLLLSM